mmetsp:Transcript_77077/g.193863  ORF Transcript_77077/g.193863 Transcript_77077/m.193863 type:complete len:340 (-) Transcript_77077:121-1140(-)
MARSQDLDTSSSTTSTATLGSSNKYNHLAARVRVLEKQLPHPGIPKESGCSALDARVQLQARSLALHQRHVDLLGVPVHFASEANSRVRPIIGDRAYRRARAARRHAAPARHVWQPSTTFSLPTTSPRSSSGSPSCCSAESAGSAEHSTAPCPTACTRTSRSTAHSSQRTGPRVRDLQREAECAYFDIFDDSENDHQDACPSGVPEPTVLLDMVTEAALQALLTTTRSHIEHLDHQFGDMFYTTAATPSLVDISDGVDLIAEQLQDDIALAFALEAPCAVDPLLPAAPFEASVHEASNRLSDSESDLEPIVAFMRRMIDSKFKSLIQDVSHKLDSICTG